MFDMYKHYKVTRKTAAVATNQTPKIYAIGRIKGEQRTRFGITDNTLTAEDLLLPFMAPIRDCSFKGYRYKYAGPYTFSCDHRCAHQPYMSGDHDNHGDSRGTGSHGSGVNQCTQAGPTWSMSDVFSRSLDGLKRADIVFVWLDDYEAHGSGVEIGYARGLGKPIFLTHAPHIAPKGELWFAFEAATQIKSFESAREAYAWFLQLVGQPSVSKD